MQSFGGENCLQRLYEQHLPYDQGYLLDSLYYFEYSQYAPPPHDSNTWSQKFFSTEGVYDSIKFYSLDPIRSGTAKIYSSREHIQGKGEEMVFDVHNIGDSVYIMFGFFYDGELGDNSQTLMYKDTTNDTIFFFDPANYNIMEKKYISDDTLFVFKDRVGDLQLSHRIIMQDANTCVGPNSDENTPDAVYNFEFSTAGYVLTYQRGGFIRKEFFKRLADPVPIKILRPRAKLYTPSIKRDLLGRTR